MAQSPRRTSEPSRLGEMPPPRAHRSIEHPEERSPDGHRKDVFASIGSGALIIGGTALLAWLLLTLLR